MSITIRKASLVTALIAVAAVATATTRSLSAPPDASAAPRSFFGIVPQAVISEEDAEYMRAARIGAIRLPIGWESIQPTARGSYDWSGTDREIAIAANHDIQVLPFLAGVPRWIGHRTTRFPIYTARARRGWVRFLRAVVRRYGPRGEFWLQHPPGVEGEDGILLRRWMPIREWQIWNEPNLFYFSFPVSPFRYARLLKLSYRAIHPVEPRARIILGGLFGEPNPRPPRGMSATRFLALLYRVPGIRYFFDGVALHPYAFHVPDLERMVEQVRRVEVRNRDARARLYITEMGWGSQYDPSVVAFEQGWRGQARELVGAYRYLLRNRRRLGLEAVYWFTWKDSGLYCDFCDSVGLFRESDRFRPKLAWRAFVHITGGRPRP